MKNKIMEKYEDAYLNNNDYDDYEDLDDSQDMPEELQAINILSDMGIETIEDFKKDAEDLAKYYINVFFNNKYSKNGNTIKDLTDSPHSLSTVINTSIISGVQKAYKALNNYIIITQEDLNKAKKNGDVTQEIKLVNETLKVLHKAGVPQQFAGGMMILYLEFCEGVSFGT
jgi:hypothetical protein